MVWLLLLRLLDDNFIAVNVLDGEKNNYLYAAAALWFCVCSYTYVYCSGVSIHDSLESIEVELWSTIVFHFGYGLPEPV